jgi:hypothetical protein
MRKPLLLLAVLLPASVAAQGLGDAAARERQKREEKKAAAPAKVFTEEDLPAPAEPADDLSTPGAPSESGDEGSAARPDPSKPVDSSDKERQERKLLEAEWRVRFANAREQIALAEAACWQEVVRTQFYNGIPVQMKVKEFVESEEHRRAKAALADLQEEFRRTGLPPGWARQN